MGSVCWPGRAFFDAVEEVSQQIESLVAEIGEIVSRPVVQPGSVELGLSTCLSQVGTCDVVDVAGGLTNNECLVGAAKHHYQLMVLRGVALVDLTPSLPRDLINLTWIKCDCADGLSIRARLRST